MSAKLDPIRKTNQNADKVDIIKTKAETEKEEENDKVNEAGSEPEFLLAFARRNVPIDRVLKAAEEVGLTWTVLDAGPGGMEPIYQFVWRNS
jgi:hypothetical protein